MAGVSPPLGPRGRGSESKLNLVVPLLGVESRQAIVVVPVAVPAEVSTSSASLAIEAEFVDNFIAMDDVPETIFEANVSSAPVLNQDLRIEDIFMLPVWARPPRPRGVQLDPSILRQVDGLLAAVCRYRVEHDLFAPSLSESYCLGWGVEVFDCLAAFRGLYLHDFNFMPSLVALAASHKASGVFIVPDLRACVKGAGPVLHVGDGKTVFWFDFLVDHSFCTFEFSSSCLFPCPGRPRSTVLAVAAQFGVNNRPKKKRPEDFFILQKTEGVPRLLPVIPTTFLRASPLDPCSGLSEECDKAPAAPPFVVAEDQVGPMPSVSKWNVSNIRDATVGYPHPRVREVGLSVMDGSHNPFRGNLSKPVAQREQKMSDNEAEKVRALCLKYVSKGFMWGPSATSPFAHARPYPPGLVPKHKYVLSSEFRLVSDISAGSPSSVNDLTYVEKWISNYFSPAAFCDLAVSFGAGVRVSTGDIPDAFKMSPNNPVLLPLFVTSVTTSARGREFFCDLCNVFGWVASESGFRCCGALVCWALAAAGVEDIHFYVDNYFHFHPRGSDMSSRVSLVHEFLAHLGVDIHKHTIGTKADVLGWECELAAEGSRSPMILICPMDKYNHYLKFISCCGSMSCISLADIVSAIGIMTFLSAGFRAGGPYVGALGKLKANGLLKQARVGGSQKNIMLKVTAEAKESFSFWSARLRGWDRVCPMLQGFGPQASFQVRGWVDSSPLLGCGVGGLLLCKTKVIGFFHEFTAEERLLFKGVLAPSSGACEMLGIATWLRIFRVSCEMCRTLLETDSEAAMLAYARAFSDTMSMKGALRLAREIVADAHISLRVRAMARNFGPMVVADLLSRGQVAKAEKQALAVFGCQLVMLPLLPGGR